MSAGKKENKERRERTSVGDLVATNAAPAADPALSPASKAVDLANPQLYLNRELTWLAFNERVLHEAVDTRTPLLERLKFLAIVASNLDEFFMKRIGGLKQQVAAGVHERTVDGRRPLEQIQACYAAVRSLETEQRRVFHGLRRALKKRGIHIADYARLKERDQAQLREHYLENIFPLVTPQAMDPAHPFPFVSGLSLNLLVTLRYAERGALSMARVKVPVGADIPRFLRVGSENRFVPLEQVMALNLDLLFPGMRIESCELFRVTRNANTERDEEEADDLLELIQSELRDRKIAPIVRLEVDMGMASIRRGMLAAELKLDESSDVFQVEGMLALGDLMQLCGLDEPALQYPPHKPVEPTFLHGAPNIFHAIRDQPSVLLHHPYESFATSVQRFLAEAATDPKVRAIKLTLYRSESAFVGHLIEAARNGKQVAVVVELKARFDEAANIRWAQSLEEYGIHVTYGIVGLKTHCKVILVVRQDYDGLKRYAHIGTGNYHPGTAKIYADVGLLTVDPAIGRDLTELFNYLTTGYKPRRRYERLLVAPKGLKRALLGKIEREVAQHSVKSPGLIRFKTNALEDADVVRALYAASQAGVKVELLVRDTCRLRPGLAGVSDNISVVSIVGRFLEHARIYHFGNGGQDEYFIGSADCMKRNLERRVEVLTPVVDERACEELKTILDLQLADSRSAWQMYADGSYTQRQPKKSGRKAIGSQQALVDRAVKRLKGATRLKNRKARTLSAPGK